MAQMAYIEAGTTNACVYPVASGNTSSAGYEGTRGAVSFPSLDRVRLTRTDTPTAYSLRGGPGNRPAVLAGQVWTVSFGLVGSSGAGASPNRVSVLCHAGSNGTGTLLGSSEVAVTQLPDGRYFGVLPAILSGAVSATFQIYRASSGDIGDWFEVNQILYENNAHPTPFCPAYDAFNAIQPGNQWNGTPHASTSTRTAGDLTIPCATSPAAFGCKWSEDGITTHTLYSESLGQVIGDYGSIAWADGELTVTTSRRLWIGQVAAFDRHLTPTEQTRLDEIIDANLLDWYV